MTDTERIRPKDKDAILQSLRAGVVPPRGLHLIQVGRKGEVEGLLKDIDRVADGGSACRFVIGAYGSGKSFFLSLVRSIAQERKLVTLHADLAPDRRLHATNGEARTLLAELARNAATRAKPEGGALTNVVEKFVTIAVGDAATRGISTDAVIHEKLGKLSEMLGGYDFAAVIAAYWRGHETGNDTLKADAVRWLRGEFTTKTDAKKALGVRTIVDDGNVYDHLKRLALLARLAGYAGLLVTLDEMVNIYKLGNSRARSTNYEQILRILNDSIQSTAEGLGILFAGTPEFLMDTRRGCYSYDALQSRLAENTFARNGLVDFSGPVLRLASLTPEDVYVLLMNIRHVHAMGDRNAYLLPDEGIRGFLEHCNKRVGTAYFQTPRESVKSFTNLLAILEQNKGASWRELLGGIEVDQDQSPDLTGVEEDSPQEGQATQGTGDDGLASFKLK